MHEDLPVAVVGAGPIGLAAASNLIRYGKRPLVLEAGPEAADAVKHWGHVRLFTKWQDNLDPASIRLLTSVGWEPPNLNEFPTGSDLRAKYLLPLAEETILAPAIRYDSRVRGIARRNHDKTRNGNRSRQPFVLKVEHPNGRIEVLEAAAVIDASGTWFTPNPIGSDGFSAQGEDQLGEALHYGIPDVLRDARPQFAGKKVLVIGSGHSAMQVVLDLVRLKEENTQIVWATRRRTAEELFRGGRGGTPFGGAALVRNARMAVESGRVTLVPAFQVQAVKREGDHVVVSGNRAEAQHAVSVDRIVAATGFRPDLEMFRELRLSLDPIFESAGQLAKIIDPATTNCLGVPRHGADELRHPEVDFFIAGMKSYGRAPTFLLSTGYEQIRSIAGHLAGRPVADVADAARSPEAGCVCDPASTAVPELSSAPGQLMEAEPASESCCGPVADSRSRGGSQCC